jgi:hypothetical protein
LAASGDAIASCEGEIARIRKPLFSPLDYRGLFNRERIDGLDDNEQVAQDDPPLLISTAESVVESLLSREHV